MLFLGTSVYLALMVMAVKTAGTLVAGWRLPGQRQAAAVPGSAGASQGAADPGAEQRIFAASAVTAPVGDDRVRTMIAALPAPMIEAPGLRPLPGGFRAASAEIVQLYGQAPPTRSKDARALGLGSRFKARPERLSREHIA